MKANIPVWVAVSILVVSVISGVLTIGANYVTIREYLEKKKATATPTA